MNSYPHFPSLLSDMGEIQPTRSAQVILDMCEFCVNWGGVKPHFSYSRQQNYIYACAVKIYGILKTSNPLVKFRFSHYTTTILIKVAFNTF